MNHRLEAAPKPEDVVLESPALVQHCETVLHLQTCRNKLAQEIRQIYQLAREIQNYNYVHYVQNQKDLQTMLNQFMEHDHQMHERPYQPYVQTDLQTMLNHFVEHVHQMDDWSWE